MPPEVEEQEQQIDAKNFLATRNAAEQAARDGKTVEKPVTEAVKETVEPAEDGKQPHLPRSVRRELNRLREEAAEARGRAAMLQELVDKGLAPVMPGGKITEKPAATDDPEPQRKDFASDAEHQRAVAKWDARQETIKVIVDNTHRNTEQQELIANVRASEEKAVKDVAEVFGEEEWERAKKEAADDPDAPKFDMDEHPTLFMALCESSERARIMYHFSTHLEELQRFLDMSPPKGLAPTIRDKDTGRFAANPEWTKYTTRQLRAFDRLEGKVQLMYTAKQTDKEKPAQGTGQHIAPKDRKTEESDARLPKPTREVGGRGGAAAPDDPKPGTRAWMEKRNATLATSRY